MSKYMPYADYQASNVEWIGEIPKHWWKSKLKFEAHINMGQSPSSDDCNQDGIGLPFLQGNAEFGRFHPIPKQYCTVAKKTSEKGEILFSVRAPVGAINLADQAYGIGRGLCSISPSGLTRDFLWWAAIVFKTELGSVSTGSTFEAVSAEQVENLLLFRPPIDEQNSIAKFLDHETAKIDTLIDKQQQLIKLLKEKRQAVISHAVTKGLTNLPGANLDSSAGPQGEGRESPSSRDAPMKDSGVEWLGEVPDHWSVTTLKHSWSVIDCKHLTAEFVDEGIPLASIREVKSWEVDLSESKKTTENYYQQLIDGNRKPSIGDIIYSRNATVGEAAKVSIDIDFAMGQDVCLIRKIKDFDTDYLLYQLKSPIVTSQLDSLLIGSTFKRINVEDIRNFLIASPTVDEQREISSYLNQVTHKHDSLIGKAQSAIELMQERRTALISAAVTGKIDVRNWTRSTD